MYIAQVATFNSWRPHLWRRCTSPLLWKETAFPRWRATDSRWNKYVVSLVSSVTAVIRRSSSCTNSTARLFQVPAVSMATGTKMWLLASCLYLLLLLLFKPSVHIIIIIVFVVIVVVRIVFSVQLAFNPWYLYYRRNNWFCTSAWRRQPCRRI